MNPSKHDTSDASDNEDNQQPLSYQCNNNFHEWDVLEIG